MTVMLAMYLRVALYALRDMSCTMRRCMALKGIMVRHGHICNTAPQTTTTSTASSPWNACRHPHLHLSLLSALPRVVVAMPPIWSSTIRLEIIAFPLFSSLSQSDPFLPTIQSCTT